MLAQTIDSAMGLMFRSVPVKSIVNMVYCQKTVCNIITSVTPFVKTTCAGLVLPSCAAHPLPQP